MCGSKVRGRYRTQLIVAGESAGVERTYLSGRYEVSVQIKLRSARVQA